MSGLDLPCRLDDPADLVEVLALQVTQPLGCQGGSQPRSQDRRIDRLGQIVERSELDAADDRVELLDGADDDDRQVGKRRVRLHPLERAVAIQIRA